MNENLKTEIKRIQNSIQKYKGKNISEADTKAIFIEPLLKAINWDIQNPEEVKREAKVFGGTSVDYALMVGGKPVILLEAKALDILLDEKSISQTVNYANNAGVVWCVLTNGNLLQVYKSNEPAEMIKKLLFEINFSDAQNEEDVEDIAEKIAFLSRESMETGKLDDFGEAIFVDNRVKQCLQELYEKPPKKLIKIIKERLKDKKITDDEILESLKRISSGKPPRAKVEEVGEEEYNLGYHLGDKPQLIVDLFNKLDARIMDLGDDIERAPQKFYVAYKRKNNFVEIEPQKSKLKVHIDLPYADIKEKREDILRDVTEIGHFGTGDTEAIVSSEEVIDYVMTLIKDSYERAK